MADTLKARIASIVQDICRRELYDDEHVEEISLTIADQITRGLTAMFVECGVGELAVEMFVEEVNKLAEADILKGNPITGAHHRAMQVMLQRWGAR